MEKVIHSQLESFLKENNILYDLQSGFRPKYSTDTCLIHLTDHIKSEMDKGNYTGMVTLDLQKAFDTVNHNIMYNKLKAIGLDDNSVNWFRSYLSGRSQMVNLDGYNSKPEAITCGVPQGSVLGPLLFLIYVNDMESAVTCKLLLYADDSALLISHKDIDYIQTELSVQLESVNKWLIDNRLSLHLGKTESILFGSKRKLKKHSNIRVICKGQELQCRKSVKYLGIEMDQNLSGELTGKSIIKKTNSRLKFFYRQCTFKNPEIRKMLCSSLIQCNFDYACSTWFSSLSKVVRSKLQICQNKMIRFINNLPNREHIGPTEIKDVGWLTVENRVEFLKLCHMHKIINGKCPEYMLKCITKTSQIHCHNTRKSAYSLFVPRVNTNGLNSFYYTGIKFWNSLPYNIQSISCYLNFKTKVKKFIQSRMEDNINSIYMYY